MTDTNKAADGGVVQKLIDAFEDKYKADHRDPAMASEFRWFMDGAEAALADRLAAQPTVPAGWKLVPVEPDAAILDAGVAMALQVSVHGEGGWTKYIAGLYRQMLAHAPEFAP